MVIIIMDTTDMDVVAVVKVVTDMVVIVAATVKVELATDMVNMNIGTAITDTILGIMNTCTNICISWLTKSEI